MSSTMSTKRKAEEDSGKTAKNTQKYKPSYEEMLPKGDWNIHCHVCNTEFSCVHSGQIDWEMYKVI